MSANMLILRSALLLKLCDYEPVLSPALSHSVMPARPSAICRTWKTHHDQTDHRAAPLFGTAGSPFLIEMIMIQICGAAHHKLKG